ncbi:hypothetical protein [Nostoc sp.]|uniref:hypothetical protein n=1 Tax=Nostoc sp. TaxID=1180 RepID=UPI002FF6D3BD
MSDLSELNNLLGDEALIHYASGREQDRLSKGAGLLELARSQELISRYLPPPPAVIFDVGGGAGVYSLLLYKNLLSSSRRTQSRG